LGPSERANPQTDLFLLLVIAWDAISFGDNDVCWDNDEMPMLTLACRRQPA